MTERDDEEQAWRIEMMIEDIVQKRLNDVKLAVEAEKLVAERDKLRRERMLAPWVLAASVAGGIIVAVISHLWH